MGSDGRPAECYISVDIEAAGPNPGDCSLLAIGACLVNDPAQSFYVELQPTHARVDASASAIHGLSIERLQVEGLPAGRAMQRFAEWVEGAAGAARPVFVGFNAPFDWMFVADYFRRCEVPNPFGHSALDIKALYMGAAGEPWERTGFAAIAARYGLSSELPHHALEDALIQAEIFRRIAAGPEAREPRTPREEEPT
jgi:DNA polymerase III epsilon subunit-like protein